MASSRMDKIRKAKGIKLEEHVSWENQDKGTFAATDDSYYSKEIQPVYAYAVGNTAQENEDMEVFAERLAMWRNEY